MIKKFLVFICFGLLGGVALAQQGASQSPPGASIYPSYFQKLPRTKKALKRFLLSFCQNNVPLDKIMDSSRRPGPKNPHGRCAGRKGYQLCLALASEDQEKCRELAHGCEPSLVEDCYRGYDATEFLVKMGGSTDEFTPFCVRATIENHMRMPPESRPKACAALRQAVLNHWGPKRLCREIKPLGFPHCRKNAAFLLGPQSCPPGDTDGVCQADTAILQVLNSHNNVLGCGDSPICRAAFTHSPKICDKMSGQFAQEYCQESAGSQFRKMISEETRFRKYNRLPSYKDGDKFLNYLPPQEKEKYYNKSLMKKHDKEMNGKYLKHLPRKHAQRSNAQGGSNAQDNGE